MPITGANRLCFFSSPSTIVAAVVVVVAMGLGQPATEIGVMAEAALLEVGGGHVIPAFGPGQDRGLPRAEPKPAGGHTFVGTGSDVLGTFLRVSCNAPSSVDGNSLSFISIAVGPGPWGTKLTADVPELFEVLVAQPPGPRQLCLWLGARVVLVYGEDGRCSWQWAYRRFTALPGTQFITRTGDEGVISELIQSLRRRITGLDITKQVRHIQSPLYVGCSNDLRERVLSSSRQLRTRNRPLCLTVSVLKALNLEVEVVVRVVVRTWEPVQLSLAERLVATLAGSLLCWSGFNTTQAGATPGAAPT
ncbi:hypothetical protein NM208_g14411 [Fusarium decemcellulare]|uniref:Uncharacterized protein n=1 Tax=Fusarium decemcellulare TaxID=57161 RepID=A0ACC1RJK9_9HYPO|nr:hypothetical protein NM208_g14411 [Fusarium decemcellulare]